MRFTAKLVTDRELERPIQRLAPDQVNAEGAARDFLADVKTGTPLNGCVPGDRFDIYETRQVHVCSLMINKDGGIDRLIPEKE